MFTSGFLRRTKKVWVDPQTGSLGRCQFQGSLKHSDRTRVSWGLFSPADTTETSPAGRRSLRHPHGNSVNTSWAPVMCRVLWSRIRASSDAGRVPAHIKPLVFIEWRTSWRRRQCEQKGWTERRWARTNCTENFWGTNDQLNEEMKEKASWTTWPQKFQTLALI